MPPSIERLRRLAGHPRIRLVLKLGLSAALLYWLAGKVDGTALRAHAEHIDWRLVACALLIHVTLPILVAERWRLLCRRLNIPLTRRQALQNVYVGQFFNQLLPSALGGDAMRVVQLARWHMPLSVAMGSIVLDRLAALSAVPFMLLPGLAVFGDAVPTATLGAAIALSFAGVVAFWTVVVSIERLMPGALVERWAILRKLTAVAEPARRVLSSPGTVIAALGLSFATHGLSGVSMWLLAQALGADVAVAPFVVLTPLVILVTAVPVSVGGWGVREGAVVTALSAIQVPRDVALLTSILFGFVMIVASVVGGTIWLFGGGAKPDRSSP